MWRNLIFFGNKIKLFYFVSYFQILHSHIYNIFNNCFLLIIKQKQIYKETSLCNS